MSTKPKVVVVDDNMYDRAWLVSLVEKAVCACEVVGQGSGYEEGLALIKKHQPNLLVTDLVFGNENMSGSDLASEVSIPVVLVSTEMSPAVKWSMEYDLPHVTALDKDDDEAIIAAIRQALGT